MMLMMPLMTLMTMTMTMMKMMNMLTKPKFRFFSIARFQFRYNIQ
jgi:hypothetical protein